MSTPETVSDQCSVAGEKDWPDDLGGTHGGH
jgi:hypothetical protein